MQMLEEFKRRQKAILRDFKARERQAQKIMKKIAVHEAALAELKTRLEATFVMGSAKSARAPTAGKAAKSPGAPVRRREGPSQKQRVHDILTKIGRPMTIAEIVQALQAEDYEFKSKKPVSSLTVMLYTNKTLFKKVKPGQFVAI